MYITLVKLATPATQTVKSFALEIEKRLLILFLWGGMGRGGVFNPLMVATSSVSSVWRDT